MISLSYENHALQRRLAFLLAASLCASASLAASAADSAPSPASSDSAPADPVPASLGLPSAGDLPPPSQNVTINLINRLVQRGVLTKEDSKELIRMAEADAETARAKASAMQAETLRAAASQAAASTPPLTDDSVRVTYVPEIVKAQLRDEIKNEVMTQARDENWAAPNTLPDWVTRFRLLGDLRVRYEGDFYPAGNANKAVNSNNGTNFFPNFNAINTGSPYDNSPNNRTSAPAYNVDQNRNRLRLRARFGAEIDLGDGFTSGFRLGTGENNSPVTENQTLGTANQAQGGNFSKYAVWVDRAFLRYDLGENPLKRVSFTVGRFDNPFFTPTTLLWANDLGFDGAAVQGKYQVTDNIVPFLTFGGFPIFNTDLNFSSTQPAKFKSEDKWLAAVQFGSDFKINNDFSTKVAFAYYDFINVAGKLSSPCTPLFSTDGQNTDDSRPSFAQNGNTYMALRNIVSNYSNNYGTINQFQYYGLATPFRDVALTARVDYNHFDPFHVALSGEFVNNLAFNRAAINKTAVNNLGPASASSPTGYYAGGDTGWVVKLNLGAAAIEKRWDWNLDIGYRYLESDAVIDAFTDSDLGGALLGTNLKGYVIGGNLGLSPRVALGVHWFSADAIAGLPYKSDVFQFDINAKF